MRIIGSFIGGPHHGEPIDSHLFEHGREPETIVTAQPVSSVPDLLDIARGGVPTSAYASVTSAYASVTSAYYTYHRRRGTARIDRSSRADAYPHSMYDQTDVQFTAWVGNDVGNDLAMALVLDVLESRPSQTREMFESSRPGRTGEVWREIPRPPMADFGAVLDLVGDLEQRARNEAMDRGHPVPPPEPFMDDEMLRRILGHARTERRPAERDLAVSFAERVRAERMATAYDEELERLRRRHGGRDSVPIFTRPEPRPTGARSERDPMEVFSEINEYLDDPWVGGDAMRCRPKRKPE
jgi:hypothetical protein